VDPHYVHVGQERYRNRDGVALTSPGAEAVAEDRRAARAAYRARGIARLPAALGRLLSSIDDTGDLTSVREAVRAFGKAVFAGTRVPFRDLADHAPINYVSSLTGRAGATE
jgi:hypothetical protein